MQIEIGASGAELKFWSFLWCEAKKELKKHKDDHQNGSVILHSFFYFHKPAEVRLSKQLREETEVSMSWDI